MAAIEEHYAVAVAKLQPADLEQRRLAINQQRDVAIAQLLPTDLEERRAAINQQRDAALAALMPPDLHARIAVIEEQYASALAALVPPNLAERRMALDQERAEALARLLPSDFQEHRAAIEEEFAARQAFIEKALQAKEAEVRAAGRVLEQTVKGRYLQMTYAPGRRSWDTERLLNLATREPAIQACLRIGEPIITIRVVTQKPPSTPRLYDIHR